MLRKQAKYELLYLKREKVGRGLMSLRRNTYKETRQFFACYMAKSTSWWIDAAWRRRMSSLIERKLTRKEDILNHDDARTNGGDKIMESSESIGSKRTMQSMARKR